MRMGQGVRTGLGHGGITCVLQTQFSSFKYFSMCFNGLNPGPPVLGPFLAWNWSD